MAPVTMHWSNLMSNRDIGATRRYPTKVAATACCDRPTRMVASPWFSDRGCFLRFAVLGERPPARRKADRLDQRAPLRIMLLTDAYLPHAGGSRVYYHNLFSRLAALGHDVTVYTTKVKGWEAFDRAEQTSRYRIRRHFEPLRDFSYSQLLKIVGPALVALWNILRRRPNLIHCGDLYPSAVIALLAKRIFGIPFVAYSHGEDITLTDERRFQPKLRDLIYHSADAIIANGQFAVENLHRIGIDPAKIHKLTPGLDASAFFPEPPDRELKTRYGLEGSLVVVTIARLVSRKGHARVLRALADLEGQIPPTKYLIAGRGPLEAELRQLAQELGIAPNVVFAGYVPDEQINQHYNLADLLAMPNTAEAGDVEGFGMVFLEANAAGKPVIGGRSGGVSEAIAHGVTGLLVASDEELREALRTLLNDAGLRARFGAAGLQRARHDFAWPDRAAALERANLQATQARSGAPASTQHRPAAG